MSESTRTMSGPAAPPLGDDVLEQVTGGVQSPRDPATGHASYFNIEIDGMTGGVTAPKKKSESSVRAVGELLENQ